MMCLWLFLLSLPHLPRCLGHVFLSFPSDKHYSSCLFPPVSVNQPPLSLTFERPGRWFADLHRDIRVQRVPFDLNQSVGQRADAVLLHRVLCVLYFVKSERRGRQRETRRGGREGRLGGRDKGRQ